MAAIATLARITVLPASRQGPRPRTRRALPHLQLDQLPSPGATEQLVEACLTMPGVYAKQSRMASSGTTALCLADEFALGPAEAFIDGHEFCHIHPEGGIHVTMPSLLREEVIRLGWGERHPIAQAGILQNLVTVYAPRDYKESAIVLRLITLCCQFAQGQLQILDIEQARSHAIQ